MATINLLPWREELREKRKKEFFFVLLGSALLTVFILYLVKNNIEHNIYYQKNRNKLLSHEINLLDEKIKEIAELEKNREMMIKRMKVIQNLQGKRSVIVHVFDSLTRSLPNDLYFTQISMTNNIISINGVAKSNSRISSFMRKLDRSVWFKRPNLTLVKVIENSDLGSKASEFNLSILQTTPTDEEMKP